MRKAFFFVVVGVFFVGLCVVAAEPAERYRLVKLDIQPVQTQRGCGPYFIVNEYGGNRMFLIFHYNDGKGTQDDSLNMKSVKVQVPDEPSGEPPNVRFEDGDQGQVALFGLSPQDRQEATCLPRPQPESKKEP